MPSYGGVPGEAQFKKKAGLPSWFSTVVFQGWCVRGLFETSKLEIWSLVAQGRLSFYWIEMKLQYVCLDSALDLWPPGHFALEFFASQIGRSEMECSALGFSYVRENLEMDNSLKWVLFMKVSSQITSDTLWK